MIKTLAFLLLLPITSVAATAQGFKVGGTMRHTDLEGGCWYLDADNGKRYELIGDSIMIAGLHQENKQVSLLVEPAKGMASICMTGEIVEVINQLDQVRHPVDLLIMPMMVTGTVHRTKLGTWYAQTSKGERYEFRNPFLAKYHHVGAHINSKERVLLDKKSTKEGMDGVILPDTIKKANGKIIEKKYDAR